jgi:hypothetical protein
LTTTGTTTTCGAVLQIVDPDLVIMIIVLLKPVLLPTTGNAIKIEFTEFATEQDYDFLEIYNGPTTSSPLLGRFSGNLPCFTSFARW